MYLDFAKAFDKADIGITFRKLKSLGIQGEIGRWLTDFLTNHKQTVLIDGRKSVPQHVTSGVPQVSLLGPLLFLILNGDIDQNIAFSFISSFVDDTHVGRHIEDFEDIQLLQAGLDAVYNCAESNNMNSILISLSFLDIDLGSTVQNSAGYKSNIGSEIEEKAHVKDLSVKLSSDVTFSGHIGKKVVSVKTKIGWVLCTFRTWERQPMLALWKQLILCDLDYCSQLWTPSKTGDIQALDLLQRSYLRCINGMQGLNY